MPKIIIFNTINSDGIGDFTYFEDIMKKFLIDSKYDDVDFTPIVLFKDGGKDANFARIDKTIKTLDILYYYEDLKINVLPRPAVKFLHPTLANF